MTFYIRGVGIKEDATITQSNVWYVHIMELPYYWHTSTIPFEFAQSLQDSYLPTLKCVLTKYI